MEWLKGWFIAITCAAMLTAVAVILTPEGAPRKVARFAGGMLMLVAVMGPVRDMNLGDLAQALSKYRYSGDTAVTAAALTEETRRSIIEQQTAAYISDKAVDLGLTEVEVAVTCETTEEGYPTPTHVFVKAAGEEEAWSALQRAITADFAIDEQGMTLERTEAP